MGRCEASSIKRGLRGRSAFATISFVSHSMPPLPRALLSRAYQLSSPGKGFLSLRKLSGGQFSIWHEGLRATGQFDHALLRQVAVEPPLVEGERDHREAELPVLMRG